MASMTLYEAVCACFWRRHTAWPPQVNWQSMSPIRKAMGACDDSVTAEALLAKRRRPWSLKKSSHANKKGI